MDLNIWLILAQIINFWILFFIFKKFLWDKLLVLIKERKEQLKKLENVNADVKGKITEAEKEAKILLEDARKKIADLERTAEGSIKQNKEKILSNASQEAESIVSWAKADIEKERLSMINSMKSKILNLSLKLNEKLFDKEKVNKDFMEKELNSINI